MISSPLNKIAIGDVVHEITSHFAMRIKYARNAFVDTTYLYFYPSGRGAHYYKYVIIKDRFY